jgi:predicted MFS family arabinose efflux permease
VTITQAPSSGSSHREAAGLLALASASFVYVTAETLPIGLLPQLASGLHVHEWAVGLLVTVYAGVAGLAALPVTALLEHRPRRQVVTGAMVALALSQFAMAVAPNYEVVLGARLVCALAHGVFWSLLAPVAASMTSPGKAGRATAIVFAGNSLALVLGTPLATALGQAAGWRVAMAVVGVAGAASAVALRATLPVLPSKTGAGLKAQFTSMPATLRSRPLLVLCAVTVLVVTGHFTVYTYIAPLVRRDAGLAGLALSAVLLGYGLAGIGGLTLTGWVTDRRPRLAAAACAIGLTAALAGLAVSGRGSAVATVAATILWGAAFTAIPVCLQSAVLRISPRAAGTASALLVVAFQIGIGGGSLAGAVLVGSGLLRELPAVGAALAAVGTLVLLADRRAFPVRGVADEL